MYNEFGLDNIDINLEPPTEEPARQYYFIAKCREWIKDFEQKDFRIKFYKKFENDKGISKSMNKGIELAKGQYITRMDSDDIIIPEKIEQQVKFLNGDTLNGQLVCPFSK